MSNKRISSLRFFALEAFLAAAEAGDQRQAAAQLGVDRSSISRNITDLETWLGKLLFTDDLPRELTADGLAFLPVAQEIVRLLYDAQAPRNLPPEQPKKLSAKDLKI